MGEADNTNNVTAAGGGSPIKDKGRFRHQPRRPNYRMPDGWNDYTEVGQIISGTRILALKVPLREEFFKCGQNAGSTPFTLDKFLAKVSETGGKVGLVIDLTDTSRYYDPSVLIENGVEYKKINCPGRDFAALEACGIKFVQEMKNFFAKNCDNDLLVGVHCTHGLNRTGYMIVRYLFEEHGMAVDEALKKFEEARGHAVERLNYIDALREAELALTKCRLDDE